MPYQVVEVDSHDPDIAETIDRLNSLAPETFPPLQARHYEHGHWWFAFCGAELVGFAGLVPMTPFKSTGYLKRAFVLHEHRGHGLQHQFLLLREAKAKQLGWTLLVSECSAYNGPSARSFEKAGYSRCEPEQRWGALNSVYWAKEI